MTDQTTELREKLTERGVEWTKPKSATEFIQTTFLRNGWGIEVLERNIGLCVTATNIFDTPEQVIAATLGRPKVKKVRGMTYDEHGGEVYFLACSGCGDWVDGDLDCIGEADGPNFCHNCGGEFDGPLLCKRCGELADMEFGDMCAECYWREGDENDER